MGADRILHDLLEGIGSVCAASPADARALAAVLNDLLAQREAALAAQHEAEQHVAELESVLATCRDELKENVREWNEWKARAERADERLAEYAANPHGVDEPCRHCCGLGEKTYANTATWRGGIGGSRLTTGPCDHCWGSGDARRPWLSHRDVLAKLTAAEAQRDRLVEAVDAVIAEMGSVPSFTVMGWRQTLTAARQGTA